MRKSLIQLIKQAGSAQSVQYQTYVKLHNHLVKNKLTNLYTVTNIFFDMV